MIQDRLPQVHGKNRTIIFLGLLLLFQLPAYNVDIDSTLARKYAEGFFIQKGWGGPDLSSSLKLVYKAEFVDSLRNYSDIAYYVFEYKPKGYVAISAWNATNSLLFYTDGDFEENRQVPAFQYWLSFYRDLMSEKYLMSAKKGKADVSQAKSGEISFASVPDFITPLLTSTWNQGCYYNELCPYDASSGYCQHALVGCVAIACAQIMNYHQHPSVGVGSHTYTHPVYGELSADFSTGYDYSLFPDALSASNSDLAEFLFHVGVAVEMDYGPTGSGAYSTDVPKVLVDYFDYSYQADFKYSSDFSDSTWTNMIRSSIAQDRPVYYSGRSGSAGHAFVCDGYDEFGLFHFNLGWGGFADGYFSLADLQYNESQAAIFNIFPRETGPVSFLDSLALVSLYITTDGDNWTNNTSWLSGNVSEWYGIDVKNGRVNSIILENNNLTGSLPAGSGGLDSLVILNLARNALSGEIPSEIVNLPILQVLELHSNDLSGSIPSELYALTELIELDLSFNSLSGTLAPEIGNLTNLNMLDLYFNTLSGSLPAEIGQLELLANLSLAYNSFSGTLPMELFDLTNLQKLMLQSNNFEGTLPAEIGNLDKLNYLYLGYNSFSGPLPASLQNLSDLEYFNISVNDFTSLPDLSACTNLALLHANNNYFSFNDIEPNLGVASDTFIYEPQLPFGDPTNDTLNPGEDHQIAVVFEDLNNSFQWIKDGVLLGSANSKELLLTNVDPDDSGNYICQVTNSNVPYLTMESAIKQIVVKDPAMQADSLALLALYSSTDGPNWTNNTNWLSGPVDTWHGVYFENFRLRSLDLRDNQLNGTIPGEIADMTNLVSLILADNQLNGSIPPEIGALTNLIELDLSNNTLGDTIPQEIGLIKGLQTLDLADNDLEGPIPDSIFNLSSLVRLYLNDNNLSGTLSSRIDSLQGLNYLYLDNNLLSGELPSGLWNLSLLRNLIINNNNFSGELSDDIGNLINLRYLYLYNNDFSGAVPASLSLCRSLYSVALISNRFDAFPDLSSLPNLTYLYLDHNNFTFEDLEPNMNLVNIFYASQANFGDSLNIIAGLGSNDTLRAQCGGANNTYQWYKDNVLIPAAVNAVHVIENIEESDAGQYHCLVSNTLVTNLQIASNPIRVKVMPAGWSYDETDYTLEGSVIARVFVAGEERASGYLASFVDEACTGIAKSEYISALGSFAFTLDCHALSVTEDTLTFQYYDTINLQTYGLNEKVGFIPDMLEGSETEPVNLNFGSIFEKDIPGGWNWLSVNVQMADMSINEVLPSNCTHLDYIKNQVSSALFYNGYGWFGSMQTLEVGDLYKTSFTDPNILSLCGFPTDPASTPIALSSGWNYLGYLPNESMPLDEALASLSLTELDHIKGQSLSATYYDAVGWTGDLVHLDPGEGYMIHLAQAGTLYYPEASVSKMALSGAQSEKELPFNYRKYEFNTSLTAKISSSSGLQHAEDDALWAYAGDEIRGYVPAFYFNPLEEYLFPILVFGDGEADEIIHFKYYRAESGELLDCSGSFIFKTDTIIGDAYNAVVLTIDALQSEQTSIAASGIQVFPNPVRDILNISFETEEDAPVEIAVYDLLGNKTAVILKEDLRAGFHTYEWHTNGLAPNTYIVKVHTHKASTYKKVILQR